MKVFRTFLLIVQGNILESDLILYLKININKCIDIKGFRWLIEKSLSQKVNDN